MDSLAAFIRKITGTFGLHYSYLTVIFSVFIFFGFSNQFPLAENLNRWDANWYRDIADYGYRIREGQQSNVAFFPLFPYLWKFSRLGSIYISLLNAGLFLLAFAFLAREFQLKMKQVLLLLSLPSLIFMYVPYTEACFFFFSTILLIGLHRRSSLLVITGLFLCCITRSATLLFFPAILFMEWMDTTPGQSASRKLKNIALYLATAISGLLTVAYIQWVQTGRWFTFFGVHEYWRQTLRLPKLPFTTWGGHNLLWLDATAVWVGLAAGVFCTYLLYRWLTGKQVQLPFNNRPLVFSAGYLVGAMLFAVLYQGGYIILNRYIFATPYFFLFFFSFIRYRPLRTGELALTGLITVLLWFLFGAQTKLDGMTHLQTAWYFWIITCYILACLLVNHPRVGRYALAGVYSLNIILQLAMANVFLSGFWVG
jgi:hypothetical protein